MVIADAAERCASGVLEITNRANLQLRGVRAEASNELIEILLAAALGPLSPGSDDVRNVLVNPTFGIDREQIIDTTALATRTLELLQTESRFHQLSPKFSISIDGGERAAMLEHPHDIWLSAIGANEPMFVFGFAGCPQQRESAIAVVPAAHALELIEATLHVFLDVARAEQTRMHHLLAEVPVAQLLDRLRQRLSFELLPIDQSWQRARAEGFAHIGINAQRQSDFSYVGAAPLLGRINAMQLRAIAQIAQTFGDGTLRMTPFQSVLLPNIAQNVAGQVAIQLSELELAINASDERVHVIACSGSRGCAKAHADTKADALQLMQALGEAIQATSVHLTGCERSCAAAHTAPFTLLAVAEGRYDVYHRDEHGHDKNACDKSKLIGFGELIARDRTIEQCADLVAAISMSSILTGSM